MSYELELLGQIEQEMEKLASIHGAITGALMQKQADAEEAGLLERIRGKARDFGQTVNNRVGDVGDAIRDHGVRSMDLTPVPEDASALQRHAKTLRTAYGKQMMSLGGNVRANPRTALAAGALGAAGTVGGIGYGGYQMAKSAADADDVSLLDRIRGKATAIGQSMESSAVNAGDAIKHHGIRSAPAIAGEGPVTGYGVDRVRNAYSNAVIATGNAIKSHPRAALAAGTIGALGTVGGVGYGGYQMAKSASEGTSKADALRAVLAANGLY